jgi:hypothetical protein
MLSAGVVGFLGYGVSLALFVLALRDLGAARTGAYFSLAPFVGAVLAVVIRGEPPSTTLLIAGCPMGFGLWLHVSESHEHEHAHKGWSMSIGIAMTSITSTSMGPTRLWGSPTPTGTGTRRSCTAILITPTCIIATAICLRFEPPAQDRQASQLAPPFRGTAPR